MRLTKNDRLLLVNLYESDEYKALRKMLSQQQLQIAQESIFSEDMKAVGYHHGQVQMIRWLDDAVKSNYKRHKKGKT